MTQFRNRPVDRRAMIQSGLLASACAATMSEATGTAPPQAAAGTSGYADVDGHRIYYERHGFGADIPIVLLHGGAMAIPTAWGDILPRFAARRPVIAIEAQGHGATPDRPGPFRLERLIDDVAGVLDQLSIAQADLFGMSLGGMTALGLAIRHPGRVRAVTMLSAAYQPQGMLPELVMLQRNPQHQPSAALVPLLPTAQHFAAWQADYQMRAPDPANFQNMLGRLTQMLGKWPGWSREQLAGIRARTLIGIGDNDFVRLEHAVEMHAIIPGAQLAILPGTTHMTMMDRGAWLVDMTEARARMI
jgi:pimeloyl-ACP methyl ester carboxylesterase